MTILLIVTGLTLTVSALCSLFEAILYSTRMTALEAAIAGGEHVKGARRFMSMKRNIGPPISAILILNTVANTAGASIAGMYAARVFGYGWVPAFSAGLTMGILFLSEVLPKTYGAAHWRAIWPLVIWPLSFIQKALTPAVHVTHWFATLFTGGTGTPSATEEEIRAMIRLGGKSGELTPGELQLLNAVFHFDELVCRQVMVPRREVVSMDCSMSLTECLDLAKRTMHTRYPLTKGLPDEIVGIVNVKDLVGMDPDRPLDLSTIRRPIRNVPESMPINRLLREMQKSRQHMAVVVDEYGTTSGIITLENILEEIVGAVQDEFDTEQPEIVPEGSGCYVAQGSIHLGRLGRELGIVLEEPNVDTLSGLLVAKLGRLLEPGDRVEMDEVRAEVLEATQGRAVRVRLTMVKPDAPRPDSSS